MDKHRTAHESLDNKSILLFCFAGRDILIATLKPTSKFQKVQDALAATGFDPTPMSVKLKMMNDEMQILKKIVADN